MTQTATPEQRGIHRRWRFRTGATGPTDAAAAELARRLDVAPLVGRLLVQRGLDEAEQARQFFEPKLTDLHDPRQLPGCDRAAERLAKALRDGEKIAIYGDYDVDGVTATAILYHVIKAARPDAELTCYVPHRIDEGYGLNADALRSLAADGVSLIISVDCGITAVEPAKAAADAGIDLIITDHHEPAAGLPDAFAVVHPRLTADGRLPGVGEAAAYPFGELCGAGVAYKLAWQSSRVWCGAERVSDGMRQALVNVLPLVALGTIADVVPLVDENRTLARFGLMRIKQTPLLGLNALIEASRLSGEKIDAYHVGFVLGPRLNACGRMGHARQAVRLLTDAPADEAAEIAKFLNAENDRRRATERAILDQAVEQVRTHGYDGDDVRAIVLADEGWHQGVVGIVCSRLVDRFHRPTVLLNTSNGHAHGSARSIDAFNIHEAFTACSDHLETFGGHAMAAGLRLATDRIDAFRDDLVAYANERLSPEDLVGVIEIDADAAVADLTQPVVRQIERLAPFGRANPTPILRVPEVRIAEAARPMGAGGKHLAFSIGDQRKMIRCVAWGMGDLAADLPAGATVDVVGEPKLNHYNGRTTVEVVVRDVKV